MFLLRGNRTEPSNNIQKAPSYPQLSYVGPRAVFLFIILSALGGGLMAQRLAASFPQAYVQAIPMSEDLFGLVTETLETGIWIVFNLITPSP